MPLGIAIDTLDAELFGNVFKIAEFNEFLEVLLPHLLGLDIDFRSKILKIVSEKTPSKCTK